MSAHDETGTAFTYTVPVFFHHGDPAGVMFFGRVFELYQAAYEQLMVAAGVRYEDVFLHGAFSTPIVHTEADYRRPIRPGESVTVALTVARLGRSSMTLAFEVTGPDDTRRASGRTVHVFVDTDMRTKIPIPEPVRAGLARYRAAGIEQAVESSAD